MHEELNDRPDVVVMGAIDLDDDVRMLRADKDGRILVACPHCRAEGKADPNQFLRITVGWEPYQFEDGRDIVTMRRPGGGAP